MATTAYGWDSFFSTTLASAITSSDTTIPLAAAPTATEGTLVIESSSAANREIIYYTGVSGNSVTLPSVGAGRGQEGTTAVAHSSGVAVKRNTTSRDFEVLQDGTALAASAVTPNKVLSGTGTTWVWQSWTPTFANLTVGNGTHASKYTQIGKTVIARVQFTWGSTTSLAGAPTFTLPVTSVSYVTSTPIGDILLDDVTGDAFPAICRWLSTTTAGLSHMDTDGATKVNYAATSSTAPFTWTTSDTITGTIIYEAA